MSEIHPDVRLSRDTLAWINGLGKMIEDYVDPKRGFEPYMITFMFRLTKFQEAPSAKVMGEEVERVYGRFLTECVRNPWSASNEDNRPILIACPDWPVRKKYKRDILKLLPWEGAHCAGVLLVPPWNRLKNGVKDHFETVKKSAYVRPGMALSRVHIEHITYSQDRVADYTLKSLKKRKATIDDILLVRRSRSER